jgi:hypothetical protein
MNFISYIKQLYQPPSAETLALRELESARRSLLEAQSAREYAESMSKYHDARIKRLTTFLHRATGARK